MPIIAETAFYDSTLNPLWNLLEIPNFAGNAQILFHQASFQSEQDLQKKYDREEKT